MRSTGGGTASLSMGQFILVLSLVVTLLSVGVVVFLSKYVEEKAISDIALKEGRQTSQLVFQGLYSVMERGWTKEDILKTVERLNASLPGLNIKVFRGAPVIREFGDIPVEKALREHDPVIRKALSDGKESMLLGDKAIRYLYPMAVEKKCQRCHDAQVGEINGVIDITYPVEDLKVSLGFVMKTLVGTFAVFLFAIFVILYFKLRYFIARPVKELVAVMQEIIADANLNRRVEGRRLRIRELSNLSDYFNRLLTTIQDYQQQLEELTSRDPLTKLYNRRSFEKFVGSEISRSKRHGHEFAVLYFDIDSFKHVNDSYGHPIGDLLLKEVGLLMAKELRKTDVLARISGDEFGILLPETSIKGALDVAEKIRTTINGESFQLPEGSTRAQVSAGVAIFPENGESVDKLSIAMEVAMYKAKRLGKNRVSTIEESEEEALRETMSQGRALRLAIDEDRVEPFFQPIVETHSGKTFAYEVLARIREDDDHVPAGKFIEAAEELGLSNEIDDHIFAKGLKAFAEMNHPNAKIFFNLSPKRIADKDRMNGISDQVRRFGIRPDQVILEITEREALPNIGQLIELVDRIRSEGFAFAIDDFGSGFSSFIYLKYLTVDYVKIEGSFVRHAASDEKDCIMVRHIHNMANEFGLKTIGEFVEDEAALEVLKEIGVDFCQGYHLGRPQRAMAAE